MYVFLCVSVSKSIESCVVLTVYLCLFLSNHFHLRKCPTNRSVYWFFFVFNGDGVASSIQSAFFGLDRLKGKFTSMNKFCCCVICLKKAYILCGYFYSTTAGSRNNIYLLNIRNNTRMPPIYEYISYMYRARNEKLSVFTNLNIYSIDWLLSSECSLLFHFHTT